MKDGNHSVQQK